MCTYFKEISNIVRIVFLKEVHKSKYSTQELIYILLQILSSFNYLV